MDGGCLLGKAGRSRFYEAWEPLAERLRKLLEESIADVGRAVGEVGGIVPAGRDEAFDGEEDF